MGSDEAFVTLATNDSYGLGALVLAHSIRKAGTSRHLAVLITPGVTESMKNQLSGVYDLVQIVDVLDSQDSANLALLARPELGITLTKLHAWNLTQYKKAVFLDADCLVLQNVDDLFQREELSAVPDVGWPDCFNTGVFVFRPSAETYSALIKFALETGSFDGGDQGLLNSFFHDWATRDIKTHLPFVYNMVATVIYSYAPAFKQFGKNVKIVHFLGSVKPWHQASASPSVVLGEFLQLWWNIFNSSVRGRLEPGLAGLAGSIASLDLGASFGQHVASAAHRQASHRRDWEAGNIDYMGADSFDNIQRRIEQSIGGAPRSASGKSPSPPPSTAATAHHSQSHGSHNAKQPTPPPQSGTQWNTPTTVSHPSGPNALAAVSSAHQSHSTQQPQHQAKQETPPPQSGTTGQQQSQSSMSHASGPNAQAGGHAAVSSSQQSPGTQPQQHQAKQPTPPPQSGASGQPHSQSSVSHASGAGAHAGGHAAVSSSQSHASQSTKQVTPPPQSGAVSQSTPAELRSVGAAQSHAQPALPTAQPPKQPTLPPQATQPASGPTAQSAKQPTPPPQAQPAAVQTATSAQPTRPSPPPTQASATAPAQQPAPRASTTGAQAPAAAQPRPGQPGAQQPPKK